MWCAAAMTMLMVHRDIDPYEKSIKIHSQTFFIFGAVGFIQSTNIIGVFHNSHLHYQTNSEITKQPCEHFHK
jgi:hypothetical protein